MASEDNIRRLRRPASPPEPNAFEELDEHERQLAEWHERRKNRIPAQGKTKTAELSNEKRGYLWEEGRINKLRKRSSPSDT